MGQKVGFVTEALPTLRAGIGAVAGQLGKGPGLWDRARDPFCSRHVSHLVRHQLFPPMEAPPTLVADEFPVAV